MKIKELMWNDGDAIFSGVDLLKGDLIALDSKDGRVLFDTRKNRSEFVKKFENGEILQVWADVRQMKGTFGDWIMPVMKCYVGHGSWTKGEKEQ